MVTAATPFEAWFDEQAYEAQQFKLDMARAFEGGMQAARRLAAASAPLVASPVLDRALQARELFGATVAAAQSYDSQFRPAGRNWARVPDEQAARLIEGALLNLRKAVTA
jgi:hypothetical protein